MLTPCKNDKNMKQAELLSAVQLWATAATTISMRTNKVKVSA